MIFATRTENDRRWYQAAVVGLILGAWIALWLWGESPHAGVLGQQAGGVSPHVHPAHTEDQHAAGHALPPNGSLRPAAFVLGWTLMTVAMMLPSSLPLVNLFRRTVAGHATPHRLLLLLGLGYVGTWAGVGVAAYLGDIALTSTAARVPAIAAHGWLVAPGLFLLAGIYQFTPFKHMCLEKCRSPYAFLVEHWRGRRAAGDALRLGIRHGLFCVGCCWTLMLLMFAAGTAHLAWMLALGAVMTAERTTRWGRVVAPAVGAALILWGLLSVAHRSGVPGTWTRALGLG